MAEAAAVGVPPHRFWLTTPRELYAIFAGNRLAQSRIRQRCLWQAWQTANFSRARKMPDLIPLLRNLEPPRVQSPTDLRKSILSIATAMGAEVVYKKRGEA